MSPQSVSAATLPEGGWWPHADQRELLRAVLLDRSEASDALDRWREAVDLDDIDVGSFGLLPLLADRLTDLGSEHADDPRILGVRRQVWAKNQRHLATAETAVACFAEHEIPAMVLKGVPMVLGVYERSSARLMADVDILIPFDLRHRAVRALEDLGWRHSNPLPESPMFRAAVFDTPGGSSVDLQWRLLQQPDLDWVDHEFWLRSRPIAVRSADAVWPSTPDLLFHLLVHGAKANPVPPLRWVTDAAAVIRMGVDPKQWEQLVDLAKRSGLSLPVEQGLRYLVRLVDIEVPSNVLEQLAIQRPVAMRRIEHRLAALPVSTRRKTYAITSYIGDARRQGRRPTPFGFVEFAKQATKATSTATLLRRAFSKDPVKLGRHG